jgi:hypothetical protein
MLRPYKTNLGYTRVEIDRDRLAALYENRARTDCHGSDDTAEMQKGDLFYLPLRLRW